MIAILWLHVASGIFALAAGALAAAARKGGRLHVRAGTFFFAAMLLLGASAAILEPYRTPPGSPLAGVFVCYFVATGWVAARRRDGRTGRFELAACLVALGFAAATLWSGLAGSASTPAGRGPVFILAALCLLAGLLDLHAYLRRMLTPIQRISRHVWRTCVAFFIATGSFFLGQQQVMPAAVRGSAFLFALAFAPFALMLFWLVRMRLTKQAGPFALRIATAAAAVGPAE